MITSLMQHPDVSAYDLSSLRLIGTGGAPVPVALMEQVKKRIGADVFIGFGRTEATCGITATLSDDPFELKAATVGRPFLIPRSRSSMRKQEQFFLLESVENSAVEATLSWLATTRC